MSTKRHAIQGSSSCAPQKRKRFGGKAFSQPATLCDENNNSGAYKIGRKAVNTFITFPKSLSDALQSPEKDVLVEKNEFALFNHPAEIIFMIADKLTLEESFNLASTCKLAHSIVSSFQKLKYDWVDKMFLNLKSQEAKARNAEYLFATMLNDAKLQGQDAYSKLFEWLVDASKMCSNLPMPLLFETLLNRLGEQKAAMLIGHLIKEWMLEDANLYFEAFPIGPDSSPEMIEVEKRLLKRFKWVMCDRLNSRTRSFIFTLLLRSLAQIPNVHKLIYLFCAPRQGSGFINFEHYAVTHQEADDVLDFGSMANAFKLIMGAWRLQIADCYSNREVFVILEDLTTAPAMWSMHSFVNFLVTSVELCVLSTYVRFNEGFAEDASSTFYYTIRATENSMFLAKVVCGVMRLMNNKVSALRFVDCVLRKSSHVISATDEANTERMKILQESHHRAVGALNAGLQKFKLKYTFRSASV